MFQSLISRGAIAAAFTAVIAAVNPAAAVTQLAFVVDESGSVGSTNFNNMIAGIRSGLDAHLPINGSVEVSLIEFGSSPFLRVAPTVVSNQVEKDALLTAISTASYSGGGTGMASAIDLAVSTLAGSSNFGTGPSLINLATDGSPNSTSATTTAAANAAAAGITSLSAESIGGGGPTSFLAGIVFPGMSPGVIVDLSAGDTVPNPLTQGFVIDINSFSDFNDAIDSKIRQTIVVTTPEPGVLALLGVGVIGAAYMRRRAA